MPSFALRGPSAGVCCLYVPVPHGSFVWFVRVYAYILVCDGLRSFLIDSVVRPGSMPPWCGVLFFFFFFFFFFVKFLVRSFWFEPIVLHLFPFQVRIF